MLSVSYDNIHFWGAKKMIKTNLYWRRSLRIRPCRTEWLRGAGKEGGSGRSGDAYQLRNCPGRFARAELREG